MTDIVEELRVDSYVIPTRTRQQAADEIEHLRAMVAEFVRLASSPAVADEDWEDTVQAALALLPSQ